MENENIETTEETTEEMTGEMTGEMQIAAVDIQPLIDNTDTICQLLACIVFVILFNTVRGLITKGIDNMKGVGGK